MSFAIDRVLFRKRFAEALLFSRTMNMPMILFYSVCDSSFYFGNTLNVSADLLAIMEIDANKIEHNLPLENTAVIEKMLKQNEDKIFDRLLPELIEKLAANANGS